MAKNVFKPTDIMYNSRKVFIEPPKIVAEEPVEEVQAVEEAGAEYSGPTADDLRREAELFRRSWEEEKQKLIAQARDQAERIRKEAEKVAFDEVKRKNNEAQKIRQEAQDQAQTILAEARAFPWTIRIRRGASFRAAAVAQNSARRSGR